jgi:hypothetical protein
MIKPRKKPTEGEEAGKTPDVVSTLLRRRKPLVLIFKLL